MTMLRLSIVNLETDRGEIAKHMSLIKKNLLSVAIGSAVFMVTLCTYFLLPYKNDCIDHLTFTGMVTAQALSLIMVVILNSVSGRKKQGVSAGGYISVFVYLVATVVLSVHFSVLYRGARNPISYLKPC